MPFDPGFYINREQRSTFEDFTSKTATPIEAEFEKLPGETIRSLVERATKTKPKKLLPIIF